MIHHLSWLEHLLLFCKMLTTLVRNGALDSDPYGIGEVSSAKKSKKPGKIGITTVDGTLLWLSRQGMTSVNGIDQFRPKARSLSQLRSRRGRPACRVGRPGSVDLRDE